ncbi:VOC family protein [Plantactinospora sp. CA-294935]|uniref:VOC family protein n=1 Tax=Plantactinospora sp. CA-294935 TaxID=3240012 RepID=UPI003D8ADAD9
MSAARFRLKRVQSASSSARPFSEVLVPPDWPDGTPQQVHLDLYVDDFDTAHEQAIALGPRLLKAADDRAAGRGVQVYADPAGHPFCLCWPPPTTNQRRVGAPSVP